MDTLGHKRTAEPEKRTGEYAYCTSCSRLSHNLKNCETCGSALSEENSTQCFSSEPKRARIENMNGAPEVRPAIQEETNVSRTSDVRPQALFVNMNNQAFPVGSLTMNMASAPMSVGQTNGLLNQPTNGNLSVANVLRSNNSAIPIGPPVNRQVAVSVPGVHPILPKSSGTQVNGSITLPSYNLQPPPPPFSSNIARLPVVVSSAPAIPTMVASAATSQSSQNWQISAVEIRIGSKKFKPISPVTFKDEGVLFMLKDFTYAPVLLNTRAIIKCRANLSTFSYPVLFLYLENSCMRQIRNIFGLLPNEFSSTSPAELRRCISIFPVFGSENRSQVLNISFSIKRTFEAMVRRYPRSTPILEEINNEQVIDTLIDVGESDSSGSVTTTSSSVEVNASTASAPVTALGSTVTTVSTASTLASASSPNRIVSQPSSVAASDVMSNGRPASSSVPLSSTTAAPLTTQNSPQVLVIPQDATRWQALQKSLVIGGVYNVMVQTGQRKYCLWNGTQLVPCMVQNTEVQVNCLRVHIGSLHAQCIGQVRIRAEPNSGIYFTLKADSCGQQEIAITPDDILSCEICFNKTTLIFISTSWATGEKVRSKLKMQVGKEPSFDPNGSDMRKKWIILFLNDVNRDQVEALTNMKFSRNSPQSAFEVIDILGGLQRLVQIKLDMRNPTSALEYLQQKKICGPDDFERLAQDWSVETVATESNGAAGDDDDDDVIMTQEEVGIKCPYTQQVMKDPVRNKVCGHNYEKVAIMEFIVRKKGTAKCPYAGCSQTIPLRTEDLVDNFHLKEYIAKYNASNKTPT